MEAAVFGTKPLPHVVGPHSITCERCGASFPSMRVQGCIAEDDPRPHTAEGIAETVAGGPYIAGHGGIGTNTRRLAYAVALRAARIALGLPPDAPQKARP